MFHRLFQVLLCFVMISESERRMPVYHLPETRFALFSMRISLLRLASSSEKCETRFWYCAGDNDDACVRRVQMWLLVVQRTG